MTKPTTVLGISAGTRTMGLAVGIKNELIDWKVRTFEGKWGKRKLRKILDTILAYIHQYQTDGVCLKIVDDARSSQALDAVVTGIQELPGTHTTITCTKEHLKGDLHDNILSLAESLCKEYPELSCDLPKLQANPKHPTKKIFEAVAAIKYYNKK